MVTIQKALLRRYKKENTLSRKMSKLAEELTAFEKKLLRHPKDAKRRREIMENERRQRAILIGTGGDGQEGRLKGNNG